MKIVAFAGSASKSSINKSFAIFTAQQFAENDIEVLDLNDYQLPIFIIDVEKANGFPKKVIEFDVKLKEADLIVISLAEHNGSYTAVFKNLFDWLSRYNLKMFENKKVILLSTAPGARGGLSVLETALGRFPRHGANIIGHFSLPNYYDNFDSEKGIINLELKAEFSQFIEKLKLLI